jgi:hypothetical protein
MRRIGHYCLTSCARTPRVALALAVEDAVDEAADQRSSLLTRFAGAWSSSNLVGRPLAIQGSSSPVHRRLDEPARRSRSNETGSRGSEPTTPAVSSNPCYRTEEQQCRAEREPERGHQDGYDDDDKRYRSPDQRRNDLEEAHNARPTTGLADPGHLVMHGSAATLPPASEDHPVDGGGQPCSSAPSTVLLPSKIICAAKLPVIARDLRPSPP